MVISDASEIQFWPTGTSSFNLEQEGYTDDYCFHQKFLCTSQRKFQGYDTEEIDYFLIGFDEDGEIVFNEQFVVTPPDPPVTIDALEDGENVAGSGSDWTVDSNPNVSVSNVAPPTESDIYRVAINDAEADTDYQFNINFDYQASKPPFSDDPEGVVRVSIFDSSMVELAFWTYPVSGTLNLNFDEDLDYSGVAGVPAYVGVQVEITDGDGTILIDINSISAVATTGIYVYSLSMTPSDETMCDKKIQFKIYTGTEITDGELDIEHEESEELFYSDFVDFVSTWANGPGSGRVLIQYKSIQNFADLIYDSESGYFNIELEGRFRKERKVTAQKVLELTEMILNTASSVKKQRKLTLDDVPDYMHTKICLILAHAASGSVVINGIEWSLEEEYEEGERPETYPLTPAEVFLTEKNYYKHNVT